MSSFLAVSLVLVLTVLSFESHAYTFSQYLNTDSGFCEAEGYDPVPVGETGYNDKTCERVECSSGFRHVVGCGVVIPPADSNCQLITGTGHYPGCCPGVKCYTNEV